MGKINYKVPSFFALRKEIKAQIMPITQAIEINENK
jgi:hypothetical protein